MFINKTLRTLMGLGILACAGIASGQTTGDTPVPRSSDGARPADGAITGGSIAPGETGGVPGIGRSDNNGPERLKRCNELTGTLREQCLLQERSSSTGGASLPGTAPGGADTKAPGPRIDPPPQNPR
jgi:hypothetical protein